MNFAAICHETREDQKYDDRGVKLYQNIPT
jgi:hypothetical protein